MGVCLGNVSGFKKNGRRPWLLAFVLHAGCPLDSSVRWNDVQGKMIVFSLRTVADDNNLDPGFFAFLPLV